MAADDGPTLSGVLVQGEAPPRGDRPLSAQTIGAGEIAATVNATTVEDTLKCLPSIIVRRRHIGDLQAPMTKIGRATSELKSLMRISYADFCLKQKKKYILQVNKPVADD